MNRETTDLYDSFGDGLSALCFGDGFADPGASCRGDGGRNHDGNKGDGDEILNKCKLQVIRRKRSGTKFRVWVRDIETLLKTMVW